MAIVVWFEVVEGTIEIFICCRDCNLVTVVVGAIARWVVRCPEYKMVCEGPINRNNRNIIVERSEWFAAVAGTIPRCFVVAIANLISGCCCCKSNRKMLSCDGCRNHRGTHGVRRAHYYRSFRKGPLHFSTAPARFSMLWSGPRGGGLSTRNCRVSIIEGTTKIELTVHSIDP